MIQHKPFSGYQFTVRVPDKRSSDGERILAFCSHEHEANGVITMHRQNKGRRASQGIRVVPREEKG